MPMLNPRHHDGKRRIVAISQQGWNNFQNSINLFHFNTMQLVSDCHPQHQNKKKRVEVLLSGLTGRLLMEGSINGFVRGLSCSDTHRSDAQI